MTVEEIAVLDRALQCEAIGMYGTFGRSKIMSLLEVSSDEVSIFLNNGFFDFTAIPVTDGETLVYRYYSLNDRWRALKRCGSYSAFVEWEKKMEQEQQRRQEDEEMFLRFQAENAKWQGTLNPLIQKANSSTIITNKNIRVANRNLIIIFLITALISCGSLIESTINLVRSTRVERLTRQLDQKDSIIAAQQKLLHAR